MYLVRPEQRYGTDFTPTFKVSNSVVLGETSFPVTQARDWKPDEAGRLAVPPVEGPKPNAHPGVGEETPLVGTPKFQKVRYVEPGKPLLGVDVRVGFWPVKDGREDCLTRITPIFDRSYPDKGMVRVMAKPGYAVGGVTIKEKTYLSGIQLLFMKLKPDGQLDASDRYTSSWQGPHELGTSETKLGGDGRLVIGIVCHQNVMLHTLGLVMGNTK